MGKHNNRWPYYIGCFLVLLALLYALLHYFGESDTSSQKEEQIESFEKPVVSEPPEEQEELAEREEAETFDKLRHREETIAPTRAAIPARRAEAPVSEAPVSSEKPVVLVVEPPAGREEPAEIEKVEIPDIPPFEEEQIAPSEEAVPEALETEETVEIEDAERFEEADWEDYGERADDFHRMISEKLVASAIWLDSFFRDEHAEIEENKTSLRVRLSSFFEESEGVKADVKFRLRLVLPELEEKFHVIITGDRDEDRDLSKDPMSKTGEIDEEAERNVNLALRYFIRTARDNNVSFKLGVRVNDFPPIFYAGPRLSLARKIDPWLFRFTQEIKWFSDEGWETKTRFDFEKKLAKSLFFKTGTEGQWFEHEEGYYYDVYLIFYQVIDEDRALEYSWNNYFETRPSHQLDQVVFQVNYRQRFWREWLFFELRPQLAFREEDDYKATAGITFAVESLFGKKR